MTTPDDTDTSPPAALSERDRELLAKYRELRTPSAARQSLVYGELQRRIDTGDLGPDGAGGPDTGHFDGSGGSLPASEAGALSATSKWILLGTVSLGLVGAGATFWSHEDAFSGVEVVPLDRRVVEAVSEAAAFGLPTLSVEPLVVSRTTDAEAANVVAERGARAEPAPTSHHGGLDPSQHPAAPTTMPTGPSALSEEMRLLSSGQQALNAGKLDAALRSFDEHRKRFPSGALATERELKRISTLCRMGRGSEARAQAARFAEGHSESPSAKKALAICEGEP